MCGSELVDKKCPICDTGDDMSSDDKESTKEDGGMGMPSQDEPAQ